MSEDKILVAQAKQGSKDAFGSIYKKYRDYLLILAVALCHDVNESEDAVCDVFVNFAARLDKFELTGSLKSYLSTCVANRIRNGMRRCDKKAVSLSEDYPVEADCDEPIDRIILNEQLEELSSALGSLVYEQREAVALHVYGRLKFKEIAKTLGIGANTVRGRYRYGIKKLQSTLKHEVEK